MAYYIRLKYNSFWGVDEAHTKEEARVYGMILLARLILSEMATLEIEESDNIVLLKRSKDK